jgi:tRNA A37 threonylcarbamoyladenosine synthetase subunit TsaC/SUA5/YrdC
LGIGCDATNADAVAKIYAKTGEKPKHDRFDEWRKNDI